MRYLLQYIDSDNILKEITFKTYREMYSYCNLRPFLRIFKIYKLVEFDYSKAKYYLG